ncbi:MAG: hypothetical protein RL590_228 [Actinomycetota bacterium]
MENLSNYRDNQERSDNYCGSGVEMGFKIDDAGLVKSLELIHLGAGNCGGNSGVTSWAFTGADHSTIANPHSLDFIGMNGAAVVTTWGLSSKSMNLSATGAVNDVHGVPGINISNLMPADFKTLQGVNNQDALIKENDFRMNKDQIEKCAGENSPEQRVKSGAKTVINNVDVNQGADRKEGAKTHYITTAWSEGFAVTHLAILSRQERRAA